MKLRAHQIGETGISLPRISLGTVKIGRNSDVKYPAAFDLPDDRSVINLLETARDLGITLLDTAPAYGSSETRLGQLLPGPRDDWLLCTKAGEHYEAGESRFDFSASAITQSVHQSLSNLRTDYLDIVLIHSDGNDLDILSQSDAIPALQTLKDQGLIRLIGMSVKTVAGGLAALTHCDVIMVTFNQEDQTGRQVISDANELGKCVLVKKALSSGHLDPADSLRFVLSEPGVHSVVLGTINTEHLRDNVAVAMKA